MTAIMSKDKRSITISYEILNKIQDQKLFQAIVNIAYEENLECTFGKTDQVTYFYISGVYSQNVIDAFEKIGKL